MDVDDSFGKGVRSLLRQIVPDAALDDPVRISAREFLGIGIAVRVWRTICITFKGNGGHGDDRTFGKPLFRIVMFRVASPSLPRQPAAHPFLHRGGQSGPIVSIAALTDRLGLGWVRMNDRSQSAQANS